MLVLSEIKNLMQFYTFKSNRKHSKHISHSLKKKQLEMVNGVALLKS